MQRPKIAVIKIFVAAAIVAKIPGNFKRKVKVPDFYFYKKQTKLVGDFVLICATKNRQVHNLETIQSPEILPRLRRPSPPSHKIP